VKPWEPPGTPLAYFYQIFPENIYKEMAKSTNKYVPIYVANRKKRDPAYKDSEF
jgi:hypothetical protein